MYVQKIRTGHIDDALQLARIHKTSISVDILSVMNNDKILIEFYREILLANNFFVAVNELDNGIIVSFAVFTKKTTNIPFFLRRFYHKNFLLILKSCLRSMKILKMTVYRCIKRKQDISVNISDCSELFIIATDTQYQHSGFGVQVLRQGLKMFAIKKCIVKTHSGDAKKFYTKFGFKDIGYERTGNWLLWVLMYSEYNNSE